MDLGSDLIQLQVTVADPAADRDPALNGLRSRRSRRSRRGTQVQTLTRKTVKSPTERKNVS